LQLTKNPNDQEENLSKFEMVTCETKRKYPWIDLIFVGELYLQAYGKENWKSFAEPIPNELTERLKKLAKKSGCWLVPGSFLERLNEHVYNTAIVFDPKGNMVVNYRKAFPWAPHEDTSFGTEFVTFEIPGIARIGLSICYDVWFPEVFRTLAWMGADVILQPSASYTPDRDAELILVQAQAIMNQCYVLNSNILLPQGGGRSIFVDPEGRIIQQVGTHEEIMIHSLDIERVRWVRENGSYAICPVWKALRDSPINGNFPIYENLRGGKIFDSIGEMGHKRSVKE
jgi:formamidase